MITAVITGSVLSITYTTYKNSLKQENTLLFQKGELYRYEKNGILYLVDKEKKRVFNTASNENTLNGSNIKATIKATFENWNALKGDDAILPYRIYEENPITPTIPKKIARILLQITGSDAFPAITYENTLGVPIPTLVNISAGLYQFQLPNNSIFFNCAFFIPTNNPNTYISMATGGPFLFVNIYQLVNGSWQSSNAVQGIYVEIKEK